MNPVSAIVLYVVIWFMCLFVILPLKITSQEEDGNIVPGTPASAPIDPMIKKKAIWVTIMATAIFVPVVIIIISGWISIEDMDFYPG
ncbi:MAG: putative secreted protein [Paracoccaceae bacterium]|jgi:predicted secreted protein